MIPGIELPVADGVGDQVQKAVELVVLGQPDAARDVLEHLDLVAIEEVRRSRLAATAGVLRSYRDVSIALPARRTVGRRTTSEIFARDHWTCRFCGARTIDPQILRGLSRLFPDTLPFHPHWKFSECHLIFWTHSSSLEHVIPFARGGADEGSNFVTTCYACNDARCDLLLEEIGWSLRPIAETNWRGLTEYLADLNAVSNS